MGLKGCHPGGEWRRRDGLLEGGAGVAVNLRKPSAVKQEPAVHHRYVIISARAPYKPLGKSLFFSWWDSDHLIIQYDQEMSWQKTFSSPCSCSCRCLLRVSWPIVWWFLCEQGQRASKGCSGTGFWSWRKHDRRPRHQSHHQWVQSVVRF